MLKITYSTSVSFVVAIFDVKTFMTLSALAKEVGRVSLVLS